MTEQELAAAVSAEEHARSHVLQLQARRGETSAQLEDKRADAGRAIDAGADEQLAQLRTTIRDLENDLDAYDRAIGSAADKHRAARQARIAIETERAQAAAGAAARAQGAALQAIDAALRSAGMNLKTLISDYEAKTATAFQAAEQARALSNAPRAPMSVALDVLWAGYPDLRSTALEVVQYCEGNTPEQAAAHSAKVLADHARMAAAYQRSFV